MKILIATEKPFAADAVCKMRKMAEEAGHEVILLEKYSSKEEIIEAVVDADAMIIRSDKATAEVIGAAKNLKIIVRAGAGYDNIDLPSCNEKKIVAMNTPGQNSNAVAELALGLMIYTSRNLFTPGKGCELQGKTLGIEGFGHIGQLLAQKGRALGMNVIIFAAEPGDKHRGWETVPTLEELYQKSNYISVNIPAKPETKGLIGYDLISKMPKGGVLVNTARKEVIDEDGLEQALAEREDIKYITDIAPVKYDELKEKFGKQIFATPKKQGAETGEANMNAGLAAMSQIIGYFADGCTKFQVNKW